MEKEIDNSIKKEDPKKPMKKKDKIDTDNEEINEIDKLSMDLENEKSKLHFIDTHINKLLQHITAIENEIQNNLMSLTIEGWLLQVAISKKLDIYHNFDQKETEKDIKERYSSIETKQMIIAILEATRDGEKKQVQDLEKKAKKQRNNIENLENYIELKNIELRLGKHMANTERWLDTIILPKENFNKINKLIDIYKYPEKYENAGIEKPKGILLYGDPNLGKSRTAKAFAKEIGYEMYHITPNNILNWDSKDPTETLSELFENIIAKSKDLNRPYIIFLEQLEEIIDNMGEASKFDSTTISNTIKNYIQKIQDSNVKIIIMASIDNTKKIDNEFGDTFLNYNLFDNQIWFAKFDKAEMVQLIERLTEKYALDSIDHDKIAASLLSLNMNTPGQIKSIFKDCMQDKVMNEKTTITTEYIIKKMEIYRNQIKELNGTPWLGK